MGWKADGTGVYEDASDTIGGDIQATRSFSVRYINDGFPDGDPPGRVVTVYFYGVDPGLLNDEPTGKYHVECVEERIVCRDVTQPGDTEEWADMRYETVPGPTHTSLEAAEKRARNVARRHQATWLKWDGRAPWEGRQR